MALINVWPPSAKVPPSAARAGDEAETNDNASKESGGIMARPPDSCLEGGKGGETRSTG
jgi:hypothetical protein